MKQIYAYLVALLFTISPALCQTTDQAFDLAKAKVAETRLEQEIKSKSDSLTVLKSQIRGVENRQLLASFKNVDGKVAIPVTAYINGKLRKEKDPISTVVGEFAQGDSLTLIEYNEGYWLASHGAHMGYVSDIYINNTQQTRTYKSAIAKPEISSPSNTSGYSTTPSRTIHTGPRGGKYYINKNGNKTYIKRK
ncbi:hypothetical protein [Pontibacter rugosus]|uniref:SH3 domain-containing protein n=1 Tax=Pontibacter rugosus TaxID=1745966 RepID=A0ABW3SJ69_9BACT